MADKRLVMDDNKDFIKSLGLVSSNEDESTSSTIYEGNFFGRKRKYIEYVLPDGTTHGFLEDYDPNGNISRKCCLVNQKLEGCSITFNENGKKIKSMYYSDNKRHGLYEQWSPSGRLMARINYVDNLREGHCEIYHESGDLALDIIYVKGKLEGVFTMFYPNSKFIQKVTFKNNQQDGPDVLYDKDFNVISCAQFKNNKCKSLDVFNEQLNEYRIGINQANVQWELLTPLDSSCT